MGPIDDYECLLCERTVTTRWAPKTGSGQLRPPICAYCEGVYGKPAKDGAFADRRTVAVGSAIAEVLSHEAYRAMWPEAWR